MPTRLIFPAALTALCVLMAAWVGTIGTPGRWDIAPRERAPERRQLTAVRAELRTAERTHAAWRGADTVRYLLPAEPSLTLDLFDGLAPQRRAALERAFVAERAEIDTPRARVVVAVLPPAWGDPAGAHIAIERIQTFAGVDANGAYCAVLGVPRGLGYRGGPVAFDFDREALVPGAAPTPHPLGPCHFWARYGEPGPAIHRWLRSGGYRFADAPADYGAAGLDRSDRPYTSVWLPRGSPWIGELAAIACQAGRIERCGRILRDSLNTPYPQPLDYERSRFRGGIFGGGEAALLASLEAEIGPERFAAFWRSDLEVEPALEAAVGEPAGEWIAAWVRARYGADTAGARLDAASVGWSMLTLGVLVGAALLIGRRRQLR